MIGWDTLTCAKCGKTFEVHFGNLSYVWLIKKALCNSCRDELIKIAKAWVQEEKEIVNI